MTNDHVQPMGAPYSTPSLSIYSPPSLPFPLLSLSAFQLRRMEKQENVGGTRKYKNNISKGTMCIIFISNILSFIKMSCVFTNMVSQYMPNIPVCCIIEISTEVSKSAVSGTVFLLFSIIRGSHEPL